MVVVLVFLSLMLLRWVIVVCTGWWKSPGA